MAETAPTDEQALLIALVQGAEKAFDNAEQLFREAELLASAEAVARALCLHQLSLEECSKVDTLGAWAVSELLGHAIDQKRILAALRHHNAKNNANAYMLQLSEPEEEARAQGDLAAALQAFKNTQAEFHATSNTAKNAALYVDWVDGAFVAPAERITEEMLKEIKELNAEFLGHAWNNVKTLRHLATRPKDVHQLLAGFVEKIEKLRSDKSDDMIAVFGKYMDAFLEEGKAKRGDRSSEKS